MQVNGLSFQPQQKTSIMKQEEHHISCSQNCVIHGMDISLKGLKDMVWFFEEGLFNSGKLEDIRSDIADFKIHGMK